MSASPPKRLHWRGYASILRVILDQPATSREVGAALDIHHNTARLILRRMLDLRLVYVHGWRQETAAERGDGRRGLPTRVFGFGDQPDVPQPLTAKGKECRHTGLAVSRAIPRVELTTFAAIVRAMTEQPRSVQDVADRTGTSKGCVGQLIRHMHKLKLVHIDDWHRGSIGGKPTRLFAFAPGQPDAPRPKPLTRVAICSNYRHRRAARDKQLQIVRALAGVAQQPERMAA